MENSAKHGLGIAYVVVTVLTAISMFFSATLKITMNAGVVHVIHDVVGVPFDWFPLLAACEIAGGVGLVVGTVQPKIGVVAALGLVVYFIGAIVGHSRAGDWMGLKAPVTALAFAIATLVLRIQTAPRAFSRSTDQLLQR